MNMLSYYHYGSASPLLTIVLILVIVAILPTWPYSSGWGYSPLGLVLLLVIVFLLLGCTTTQSLLTSQLAKNAVTAVAQHYGGAKAGELASAGLYATADVLQGYVDKKPPLQVAANSPGVKGVSQIVVDYLKTKGFVSQQTVDNIHHAAQIAANATVSTVNEGP